jgi:TIR domain-containing protein/trypsin-like peptidase
MVDSWQDAVVLITSKTEKNNVYGTGFVVYRNEQGTYVLTCTHIIDDAGGKECVKVNNISATVVASSPASSIDIAVLLVAGLEDTPFLRPYVNDNIGNGLELAGYYHVNDDPRQKLIRKRLSGKFGDVIQAGIAWDTLVPLWEIEITSDDELRPGNSGSPVVDKNNYVRGIVNTRLNSNKKRGWVTPIEALQKIWPEMPPGLLLHNTSPAVGVPCEPLSTVNPTKLHLPNRDGMVRHDRGTSPDLITQLEHIIQDFKLLREQIANSSKTPSILFLNEQVKNCESQYNRLYEDTIVFLATHLTQPVPNEEGFRETVHRAAAEQLRQRSNFSVRVARGAFPSLAEYEKLAAQIDACIITLELYKQKYFLSKPMNIRVISTPSREGNKEHLTHSEQAQKSSREDRSSKPNNIFISYSHRDLRWLKRLQVHLKPLEQIGMIAPWDDTSIQAGTQWREEIKNAIASAKAAVLLISADFLSSDFISTDELPPLLTAAERQGTIILPIIISPCLFQQTKSLSRFQSVNPPHRPLSKVTRNEQEEIFVKVAETIESIFHS